MTPAESVELARKINKLEYKLSAQQTVIDQLVERLEIHFNDSLDLEAIAAAKR